MKKYILITCSFLFLLLSSIGFSQSNPEKNYYPSIGLQVKVLQLSNEQEAIAPSLFFKSTYVNNPEKSFSFGASAYPSLTCSPSKNEGTVMFGAELPLALEIYFNHVEKLYPYLNVIDYQTFFIGFGATAGFYFIREHEDINGIGPSFFLGGSLPFLRGLFGYRGSMSYFNKSLQATLGLYYEIGS